MFGAQEQAGQPFTDAWTRTWWPLLAFVLGVAFIVVGGILFSS
jgi:hypothetical protein